MDREDDKRRTAAENAAERAGHEHPAKPEQADELGFAEGEARRPQTPDEEAEPNYARGVSHEVPPGTEHHGRFSEGQEDLPDTPEKQIERRFSEGIERSPTSE